MADVTDSDVVSAGGVTARFSGAELVAARDQALSENLGVAARIAGKDAGLWGPEAAAEAKVRLGWLDCATVSPTMVGLPAHSAPIGFVFTRGSALPAMFGDGALITTHGSWNRQPPRPPSVSYSASDGSSWISVWPASTSWITSGA